MIKEIQLIDNSFASEIMYGCVIKDSYLIEDMQWLAFDDEKMDDCIGEKIKEIVEHIIDLRNQHNDGDAIKKADDFFQSFDCLVKVLEEQNNFHQITAMWNWLISKVKSIEEEKGIEFGNGVHKGTAFYFLGITRLIMGDVDGAYLWFSEAAEEDKKLPVGYREGWEKGLSPAEKILALDLSKDNYGYNIVKQIRDKIENSWRQHPEITRTTSVFTSIEDAIKKDKRDEMYPICYTFTKAVVLFVQLDFVRPTYLAIVQMGESILRFARALEDFIRSSEEFKKWSDDKLKENSRANTKTFAYCNEEYGKGKWSGVDGYNDDISGLIDDFKKRKLKSNGAVELSKDEINLIFTLKIRNHLAHRILAEPKLLENYIEIVLGISSTSWLI